MLFARFCVFANPWLGRLLWIKALCTNPAGLINSL